jgi:hypothetical protein
MAIAFDVANSAADSPLGSSFSWSHTCTGANLILVVMVGIIDTSGTPASVSGITYNGVSLTKIRRDIGANANFSEMWYLIAPATGANTVAVTLTSTPAQAAGGGSVSLTGVSQSGVLDAQGGATASSGQPSVSLTTTTLNDWILDIVQDNNFNTVTPSGSQVERWSVSEAGASRLTFGSSLGPVNPAGSTTMSWTGITTGWVQSAAAFIPAGAAFQPDEDWWVPPPPIIIDSVISVF